jgi:endonuclease-3|tara:strand:+ start:1557 stop:2180 length:624 start_codon:yes stop_codon:yes gene_type:complete
MDHIKIENFKELISKLRGITVLEHFGGSPFVVLISTILSQRTRDENTLKASNQLFSKYKTPKELATAPIEEIEKLIKPSGFYRVKSMRIKEVAEIIMKKYNNKVPDNIHDLLQLPGVGRKTANCVLVYGFRQKAIPVDIHVHRISNRLGLVKTKTPERTEEELCKIIPEEYWLELNEIFVKFGQQICRPLKPLCSECPISQDCISYR